MPDSQRTGHTFHIPVMGTGFTIDTPLRVARYGIDSVISLVDDVMIEQYRRHHARQAGLAATPVRETDPDPRATRITRYLDLIAELLAAQRDSRTPADCVRAARLLPESADAVDSPGAVDVNIMTKLDRAVDRLGRSRVAGGSDALAALRGFAQSTLSSAVVLSAGINTRLFTYLSTFADFLPDRDGKLRKRVTLKVSDFRSAEVQGRYLAKLGVWVSEFRVESPLNCGGHAFGGTGQLMGPVLAQFQTQREALRADLGRLWRSGLASRGITPPADLPPQRLTAQGGVGTPQEHRFLLDHFGVESVGWGTPFLLVPEAVAIDPTTLASLAAAGPSTVALSDSSPLGVPFWTLRTSASEWQRRSRIAAGRPGSPCRKGHIANNTEFGAIPLCESSRAYQEQKIAALEAADLDPGDRAARIEAVQAKACICHDLGGAALSLAGLDHRAAPAVCPGPNIVNFDRSYTLEEMVDHIYGRVELPLPLERPHMFLRELELAIEHLLKSGASNRETVRATLTEAVGFYRGLVASLPAGSQESFEAGLEGLSHQLVAPAMGHAEPVVV